MHLSLIDYLIVLPLVFFAGLIDSIAGGGGLISMPTYLSIGLPPHLALGSNKFSSCWGTLFATGNYWRNNMIDVPVALISAAGALIGSYWGTRTVLLLSPTFLNYLLVALIPIIAVITIFNQKLGRADLSGQFSHTHKWGLGLIAGIIIGFYDGFFGPGTGTFLILFYAVLLKYDFVIANGNTKVVNLASNLASVITFAMAGKILYAIAIPAAMCGIAGNIVGSKMVVLRGNKLIRPIFILALALLMIRVVWNLMHR